ncbi:MAG: hypothetical protein ONA90_02015, partial [candidate division KSB1 bacterium]|nr:hypothetical protein [candidate division KSB1 bacterium]
MQFNLQLQQAAQRQLLESVSFGNVTLCGNKSLVEGAASDGDFGALVVRVKAGAPMYAVAIECAAEIKKTGLGFYRFLSWIFNQTMLASLMTGCPQFFNKHKSHTN